MNSGLWFSDLLRFLSESLLSSCGAWRWFRSYRDGWRWGGGAQGPTSCLKWNRPPFTFMICRTLHEILFYKRVLAVSVCYLCNKALSERSYRQVGRACHTAGCSSGAALPGLWVSQGGSHPSWNSGPGRLRLGTGLPSLPKQITWPGLKSLGGAVHGSQCGCDQVTDAEMVEELGPVMQSTPTTYTNCSIIALSKFENDESFSSICTCRIHRRWLCSKGQEIRTQRLSGLQNVACE